MRMQVGEERTEEWLRGMKTNGAKTYAKNTPIIEALAAGEIDLGLPNPLLSATFQKEQFQFPRRANFL